ncbi:serine/threonine-protein phosphatase 6 regulatory ankyrin repeat subunit B-like [Acanthaster planci]|uniref:Serine/threonine-protein phosphatase 6 regulatory ankyrin repeat subunit B-like n=1 Tax=Acanthaster planci TaxID=133434 RepID=A0A8B7YZA6_ACAPL|nr:serine/threonine-protein phosphatase 6 regulatory ankyrin repeat subunit B-like [Acanthaster planci]
MFEVKNEKEIPEVSTFVQCKRSIRAVLTNDMNLLKKLIEDRDLPSVFHKRGVDVPRTALDYAVRTENHAALKLLLTEIDSGRERASLPEVVMKYQSSGRVAFSSSGHQSRNIFLGRGNKEGNNAFTKDTQNANPRHQYIDEVIECGVSLSTIDLILATDPNAEELLFRSIHKIAREGHYKLAGYLVDKARKLSRLGFNKVHQEVLLAERPEDLSPCLTISVKKKAYYEVDKITPVHFAAINPNPKILEKLMSILPEYAIEDDYGLRPIHYAAACEGSGPLEFLLKRGVNPEEKHKGGVTPLMIASKRGRAQNVEVLLKKIEADSEPNEQTGVRRKTAGGNLAIHFAAEGGNVDCIRSLVNHGADIESKMGSYHNKITPLMIATKYGHFELVEALLDMGAVIQQKDKFNRTALMLACMNGNYPITALLLRRGADPNSQDSSGNTATHYAAAYGWWHCLNLLLEAGADPNVPNDWKTPPLGVAFMKGHIGCSDLLLGQSAVDVNFRDNSGATMLSLTAASPMTSDMVGQMHYLMGKKADLTLVDIHGRNALHYLATSGLPSSYNDKIKNAVETAKLDMAKLLIQKGCNASARDKDGNTPINIALQEAGSGSMELVKLLLDEGSSLSLKEREDDGGNALHTMARNCRNMNMGVLLPIAARNIKQEKSHMKTGLASQALEHVTLEEAAQKIDDEGYTPLLRCAANSYPSMDDEQIANVLSMMEALVEFAKSDISAVVADADDDETHRLCSTLHLVCSSTPLLTLLLKWKPQLELFNKDGFTPLHLAIKRGQRENTELLIKAGADVNQCTRDADGEKNTPLLLAARHKMHDMLPILVASGANINAVDVRTEKTALHYVMNEGTSVTEILANAKVLLEIGADPNALDGKGRTPLHYAVNLDTGSFDGSPSIAELLIKYRANMFVQDVRGRLPLHYAFVKMKKHRDKTQTDPIEIVTVLLGAMKGKQVDTQDKFGQTPLHWAAYRGSTISAKHLVEKSKKLDIKDNHSNTPLAMAVLGGNDSVAIILIEAGANINLTVTFVPPSLEDPAKGQRESRKLWVWKPLVKPRPVPIKAPFVQAVVAEGWQNVIFLVMARLEKFQLSYICVMQAIFESQKLQLASTMLLKQPDDKKVQATNSRGRNFLHLLSIHADSSDSLDLYEQIAIPLLERGVKLFARDDKGCTPLHYAAANQNAALCKLLAERDEANFKKSLNCKDGRGRTPMAAVFWNIGFDLSTMAVIRLFTKFNASLDLQAPLPDVQARVPQQRADTLDAWYHGSPAKSASRTPLILYIHTNDFHGCQFLLQNGASCNYADEDGLTPLMHIVRQNELDLLQLLLNNDFEKAFVDWSARRIQEKSLSTWAVNLWEQRSEHVQDPVILLVAPRNDVCKHFYMPWSDAKSRNFAHTVHQSLLWQLSMICQFVMQPTIYIGGTHNGARCYPYVGGFIMNREGHWHFFPHQAVCN